MMGPPSTKTPSKAGAAAVATPQHVLSTPSHTLARGKATPTPTHQQHKTPIHQTSSTPIVDLSTIERNKENILSLRGGRSAHALSQSFSMQLKDRLASLEATRAEFERSISSAENEADADDPLEMWVKYVHWVVESYPSGQSLESGLVPLLERVTRHFKDHKQYKNDPRYLKMWILYARHVECPRDIYHFCLANEIGTGLAGLYEGLAVVYSGQGILHEADAIYRLGIARKVQPLDRIKRHYAQFQSSVLNSHSATSAAASSSSGHLQQRRTYEQMLQESASQARANAEQPGWPAALQARSSSRPNGASGPAPLQLRTNTASSNRGTGLGRGLTIRNGGTTANGARVPMYVDPEEGERSLSSSSVRTAEEPWTDAGTRVSRRQENRIEPSAMAGTRITVNPGMIKRKGGASGGAAFDVFQDDDQESEDECDGDGEKASDGTVNKNKVTPSRQLREQKQREAEELRKNPFKHWSKDTKLKPSEKDLQLADAVHSSKFSSMSKSRSGSSRAGLSSSTSGPKGSNKERHVVDIRALYPKLTSLSMLSAPAAPLAGSPSSATPATGLRSSITGERAMEEVLVLRNLGASASAMLSDTIDPWCHLDHLQGRWLPDLPRGINSADISKQKQPLLDEANNKKPALGEKLFLGYKQKPVLGEKKAALGEKKQLALGEKKQPVLGETKPPLGEKIAASGEESQAAAIHPNVPSGGSEPLSKKPSPALQVKEYGNRTPDVVDRHSPPERAEVPVEEPEMTKFKPRKSVTVTMMTAAAKAEVLNMFNGHDDEEDSDSDSDSDEDSEDEIRFIGLASDHVFTTAQTSAPNTLPMAQEPAEELPAAIPPPTLTSSTAAIPSTPIRKPFQPARGLVAAGQPNLNRAAGPSAQRVSTLDAAAEEDDEVGETEYEEAPGGASETDALDGDIRRRLSTITEVTEITRFTYLQTPGTARSERYSRFMTPSQHHAAQDDEDSRPGRLAPILDDASFVSDSNITSEHTCEDPSRWGDRVKLDIPDGLTVVRVEGDRTDQLSHEQIGTSLHFAEHTNTEPIGMVPNPCSPDDPTILGLILRCLDPPLESQALYMDLHGEKAANLPGLLKRAQQIKEQAVQSKRKSGGSSHSTTVIKDWLLDLGGHALSVRQHLGQGGFASVFLAEDLDGLAPITRKRFPDDIDSSMAEELADLSVDSLEDPVTAEQRRLVAVKVESPPNKWEFYMLSQLQQRVSRRTLDSIISARRFVEYEDESYLMLDYGEKGTLLELVNHLRSAPTAGGVAITAGSAGGDGVEELLAMFFVIELLRVVEDLHANNIIHGDLKIDNCLLRLDDAPIGETWSNVYSSDGANGWASKGLMLIDFGRSIDLNLYPEGQTFKAAWIAEQRDCREMCEGRPWTFETDYHGIAAIAHTLLFGKYIETSILDDDPSSRTRLRSHLRRYWQEELWSSFFDLMLNPKLANEKEQLPILEEMRDIRGKMEEWVTANCKRGGKNLKSRLTKLQSWRL
ncbi:hypothetical protein K437DRAFT_254457 [Tilletiaria anomala UBC 951]|uniref:BUB protein kinase n=1 Tax=Tilletiaria anomala (strain ATCC 24038 / CBS 436.72 / UBC 951) TaxID=1037660 RepID=A0A066WNT4_TILAU|nr:uncharacterized protein K437DRAFT_254457 [Tilletiaria anomala UBC 951]KDN52270.1 hypothetical protein K437DRAFT_254457 [Tilletiaria anomala UBC 951]